MTQTAPTTRPVTGLIPNPRATSDGLPATSYAPEPETFAAVARRAFAVARGLRSLRPVPARAQQPYGESDGQ
ncbi:hypothetical protein [Kitasatospora sp. MAP5-34]|uniref:hypothetical protein n=1 Tax=Kitasatospora sp. MAP5-34 TaxID=3035102 RepID=UPI002475A6BC|nr:hypothetical protein [Kitasatospora sp. MAP5-34]MDH6578763.1 hypothetical protein [Kitasatospora sp. MAP5-34]